MTNDVYITALEYEKANYLAAGKDDRAAEVDVEIDRVRKAQDADAKETRGRKGRTITGTADGSAASGGGPA